MSLSRKQKIAKKYIDEQFKCPKCLSDLRKTNIRSMGVLRFRSMEEIRDNIMTFRIKCSCGQETDKNLKKEWFK